MGICCLFLITYRTAIAFLSESKAITVYINKFGEQYFDLVAVVIIWIICIMGFIILIRNLRVERKPLYTNLNINPKPNKNKIGFLGYFSKSSKEKQDFDEK